jgi:hypothetical protein
LRKDSQALERQVLNWNPQGRRERTWRRTVEKEIGKVGKTWKEVGVLAQNRIPWRCLVEAPVLLKDRRETIQVYT